ILGLLIYLVIDAAYEFLFPPQWPRSIILPSFLLGLGVMYMGLVELCYRALPLLFARGRRRQAVWRKRLAALLSVHFGLAPRGLAHFLEDDSQFALYMQRFLAVHQVPYSPPLYDHQGRYLFAAPRKVDVLAKALMRAVGKGHDNELFVLLADLL